MSKQPWALILGASSGFGEATALELARAGMNIFGVHLDRRESCRTSLSDKMFALDIAHTLSKAVSLSGSGPDYPTTLGWGRGTNRNTSGWPQAAQA